MAHNSLISFPLLFCGCVVAEETSYLYDESLQDSVKKKFVEFLGSDLG